jgi:hypothetical protein
VCPESVAAPATVSGESSVSMPLGFPGKATEGNDPQARRPAVTVVTREHVGRGVLT